MTEGDAGGELPLFVSIFLYLFAYLAFIVLGGVAFIAGAAFCYERLQSCPCPLCMNAYKKKELLGR